MKNNEDFEKLLDNINNYSDRINLQEEDKVYFHDALNSAFEIGFNAYKQKLIDEMPLSVKLFRAKLKKTREEWANMTEEERVESRKPKPIKTKPVTMENNPEYRRIIEAISL